MAQAAHDLDMHENVLLKSESGPLIGVSRARRDEDGARHLEQSALTLLGTAHSQPGRSHRFGIPIDPIYELPQMRCKLVTKRC